LSSHTSLPTFRALPEQEIVRGAEFYRNTLQRVHACLKPDVYLEIGVRHGLSLALSAARISIGVDPMPELQASLDARFRVVTASSDAFFAGSAGALPDAPIDLAFIDGMHWFEFALRDFINVEQRASRCGAILFDDIFPNHPLQAERTRQSGVWTGDVWKILPCLRKHRPELTLLPLDTHPSGLLAVANLDPDNRVLSDNYADIVREFTAPGPVLGADTLSRDGAWHPADARLCELLDALYRRRQPVDGNCRGA